MAVRIKLDSQPPIISAWHITNNNWCQLVMALLQPVKHYAVPQGGHLWRAQGETDAFPNRSFQNTVISGARKMLGEPRGHSP